MKPFDVDTHTQLSNLDCDNVTVLNHWIQVDGSYVTIAHKPGHKTLALINIPRTEFNALVHWYISDQKEKGKGTS